MQSDIRANSTDVTFAWRRVSTFSCVPSHEAFGSRPSNTEHYCIANTGSAWHSVSRGRLEYYKLLPPLTCFLLSFYFARTKEHLPLPAGDGGTQTAALRPLASTIAPRPAILHLWWIGMPWTGSQLKNGPQCGFNGVLFRARRFGRRGRPQVVGVQQGSTQCMKAIILHDSFLSTANFTRIPRKQQRAARARVCKAISSDLKSRLM